jgi:lysozyme
MAPRQLSPEGMAFIQQWEALRLTGYLPTGQDVPTAGWGHTGPDVVVGQTYSMDQCRQWFQQDIQWACEAVENDILPILTQHQFDALVSLCFNIGAAGFGVSHVARYLNAQPEDVADAADSFLLWDKQSGSVVQGLLNRREDERQLFLTPDAGAE